MIRFEILDNGDIAAQYLEYAKNQFDTLDGTVKNIALDDCIIRIRKYDSEDGVIQFITEGISGFVFHPRTGSVEYVSLFGGEINTPIIRGGWGYNTTTKSIEALTTSCVFPIIDSDNASFLMTPDGGISNVEHLLENSGYGNFYTVADDIVYSWKGSPNIHSQVSCQFPIPCVGDGRSCSGFYHNIYSGGVVVGVGPKVGSSFAYILGLRFIDGVFYAVVNYEEGSTLITALVSTKTFDLIGTNWDVILTSSLRYPDLPWYIINSTSAVCSNGDTLTAKKQHVLSKTLAGTADGSSITYVATTESLYEGDTLFSTLVVYHNNQYSVRGDSTQDTSTERKSRSEFLPDTVQITRNGSQFCAAAINSEGHPWFCSPCTSTVTWSGPVIATEGTNCAVLESECYPPGTYDITVGATIRCGEVSVSGSVTIQIVGSAGFWGNPQCLLKNTTLRSFTGGCSEVVDDSARYCDPFEATGSASVQTTSVVEGNKKYEYVQGLYQIYTTDCPCACKPEGSSAYGNIEGTIQSEVTSKVYLCYTQQGDTYFCSTASEQSDCSPAAKCSSTLTQQTKLMVPFGVYTWVCL